MSSEVRVRFAPSPTGYLHVGGARTTLYNFLFARQKKGKFILRIEDTDEQRSTDESLKMVIEDLQWLGLNWDEGPDAQTLKDHGSHAPYRQSQRLDIYKEHAEKLLREGKAYYCFMTDAEIERNREEQMKNGQQPHIQSPYADWDLPKALEKLKTGAPAVVRFKTKNLKKDYIFQDLVRGEVKFPSDMVGDFVLLRSGGMPVYNFCCVVDDYLMKMTHILRAEEHLSNTLRQLMIYEAFGWEIPKIGHISLVLDQERKKLSKRAGATSCYEFRQMGYLPEAMNNYLALLGWSHPEEKEIFPMEEMIEKFSFDRLNSSGAIFDVVKLRWVNAQYLRSMDHQKLAEMIKPFLDNAKLDVNLSDIVKSIGVFKPYMEILSDSVKFYKLFFDKDYAIIENAATQASIFSAPANVSNAVKVITEWRDALKTFDNENLSEENFLSIQKLVQTKTQVKGAMLFQPIRVAVIGSADGVQLKDFVPFIRKSSLILRAEMCLEKIKEKTKG